MNDDDTCYECTGYGDDYFMNDDGELECWCLHCWVTKSRMDMDDWDD